MRIFLNKGYKHYQEKNLKRTTKREKIKMMKYITPVMDHYPRNTYLGNTDLYSDISC